MLPSSVAVPSFTLVSIANFDGTAEGTDDMLGVYTAVLPAASLGGLSGLWTNGSYYVAYESLDGGASYVTRVVQYTCTSSSTSDTVFYETAPAPFDAAAPLGSIGMWMAPANKAAKLLYIVSHNVTRDVALNIVASIGTVLTSPEAAQPSLSAAAQDLAAMLSSLLAALMPVVAGSADEQAEASMVGRLAATLTATYPNVSLEDLALSAGFVFNSAAAISSPAGESA